MQYTLVINSCGRPDLLKRTWDSFQAVKDICPAATIVVDDSDMPQPSWLPKHSVKYLSNGTRRGQIYSIDRAYDEVKTDYIFHCEDDWGFRDPGFLEASLNILEKYADILQVWLRGIPTHADIRDRFTIYRVEPDPIRPLHIARYYWDGWAGGFSFNPGLRRLSDYRRIGSYGRHVGYDPRGCGERQLGRLYHNLGYSAAILPHDHVYHIGDEAHIDRKVAPEAPKILVAIPTADCLDYREFRAIQQQRFGRTWPHGISGLQHNGANQRRLAVADTWWKDLGAYHNVTGKFFTGAELGCSDKFVDLPEKNRRMCRWAVDNGFDRMFRCDDDTFVHVDRMVRQTLEFEGDYAGWDCGGFGIGGAGVWLSRKAMEIVASSDWEAGEWRDDAFIGAALKTHGICMHDMPGVGDNICLGPAVTIHPVGPERMRELYGEVAPRLPDCIDDER